MTENHFQHVLLKGNQVSQWDWGEMTKCCTCLPVYEDYDEHNESNYGGSHPDSHLSLHRKRRLGLAVILNSAQREIQIPHFHLGSTNKVFLNHKGEKKSSEHYHTILSLQTDLLLNPFSILLTRVLQSGHAECKCEQALSDINSLWIQADCPCRPVCCWLRLTAAGLVVHSTSGCWWGSSLNTPPPLSEPPPHACRWPDQGSLPREEWYEMMHSRVLWNKDIYR